MTDLWCSSFSFTARGSGFVTAINLTHIDILLAHMVIYYQVSDVTMKSE